ncbi:MAG: hypothetical protein WD275_00525, partial [Rhodothermales bacterium]
LVTPFDVKGNPELSSLLNILFSPIGITLALLQFSFTGIFFLIGSTLNVLVGAGDELLALHKEFIRLDQRTLDALKKQPRRVRFESIAGQGEYEITFNLAGS